MNGQSGVIRLFLCFLFAGLILGVSAGTSAMAAGEHYMVPSSRIGELPATARVVHDYGNRTLVELAHEGLPQALLLRSSQLESTSRLSYRGWSGSLQPVEQAARLQEGYVLLGLAGPMDMRWQRELLEVGIVIVDQASPYGLLVHASPRDLATVAARLHTSAGAPVITGIHPLPETTRFAPELRGWLFGNTTREELGVRGEADALYLKVEFHADVDRQAAVQAALGFLDRGPEFLADSRAPQFAGSPQAVRAMLDAMSEVAFVQPVHERQRMNNISMQEGITNIEPVWNHPDLGYNGAGLIAGVNDSGVETGHPDFPAGVILATAGAMNNTDNGHGTHVTGTVAGRGAILAPVSASGCGDQRTGMSDVRGAAWGAQVVHNNVFVGGVLDEGAMMTWQAQQGAVINNNSWGYSSTSYGSETVAIDAAVRNAIPSSSSNVEMSIVFSAGNSGAAGITKPANAKNVITVGASQNDRCGSYIPSQCSGPNIDGIACFSSRGPSQSRIKPDIVAPGTDILSTGSRDPMADFGGWDQPWTGPDLALMPGTSMASPLVTGAATVYMEYHLETFGQLPSPALLKAVLINTATNMGGSFPSNIQGWGRLDLLKAVEGPANGEIIHFDQHEVNHLTTGQSWVTEVSVSSDDEPLRLSLVWTDPEGSTNCSSCLINDLDLIVTAPDGTVYRGNQFGGAWSASNPAGRDSINNVENVYIELPQSGLWTVEVNAVSVSRNPRTLSGQDFALTISGALGGLSVDPVELGLCSSADSTEFTLSLSDLFDGTTQLSISGVPANTSGSFSLNPVVYPATESVYTLSDLSLAAAGEYLLEFEATDSLDSDVNASAVARLVLFDGIPGQTALVLPADGATDQDLRPEFQWQTDAAVEEYQLQVATDAGFANLVIDELVSGGSFIDTTDLATGTEYYWRVQGSNRCGDSGWSNTYQFQTRFEPIADVSPRDFQFQVPANQQRSQALSIGNTGTGNLTWALDVDLIPGFAGVHSHDPDLDEVFSVPDFTLVGSSSPSVLEFTFNGGLQSRGEVVGFSFSGTVSGISGSSWASDMCMIIKAPDGTLYGVGGYSRSQSECLTDDWNFPFAAGNGSYSSSHDDVFNPALEDQGEWRLMFLNDWASNSASNVTWSNVEVTLFKQPLPVCQSERDSVPWLTAQPWSGAVAAGDSEEVEITVDGTQLGEGMHMGWLCLETNDTGPEGLNLLPIPVEVEVTEPEVPTDPHIFDDRFEALSP